MAVSAAPLDAFVAEAVLVRLDGPQLQAALYGRAAADEGSAGLSEQVAADTAQLAELAEMWAARDITATEWHAARKPIEARRTEARRRITQMPGNSALNGLIGNVDHALIGPGNRGARSLDPARFDIKWRL